jgi:Flp pilus assembly protein TadD
VTVALVTAAAFAYGSFALSRQPSSFAAAGELAETARRFLPVWYEPLDVTAAVASALVPTNPEAAGATLYWREQAASKEPDRFALWSQLATDEVWLGELEDAERHFQRALVENPWSIQTLNGLGDLYRDTGRPDDARWAYERSLLVVPDQPDVRAELDGLP